MTPITKPTLTTCMAKSLEIPKRLQATGMSRREPPATPEAPQAENAATILRTRAVPKSTLIPSVLTAAKVRVLIVIAAPAMLIVAPRGIETEKVSGLSPRSRQSFILTGMLASELRVKKAVTPLTRKQRQTKG